MTSPYLPSEEPTLPENMGLSPLLAFYRRWREIKSLEDRLDIMRGRMLPARQAAKLLGISETPPLPSPESEV